jgi:hypothetical protein
MKANSVLIVSIAYFFGMSIQAWCAPIASQPSHQAEKKMSAEEKEMSALLLDEKVAATTTQSSGSKRFKIVKRKNSGRDFFTDTKALKSVHPKE